MNYSTGDLVPTLRPMLDKMRAAHRANPNPDRHERDDRLRRLEEAIVEFEEPLVAAIEADFLYRSPDESRLLDVALPIGSVRKARRSLRRHMRPSRADESVGRAEAVW